ncbi:hypothetical protein A1507_21800 [Methylomonas koyamae]|uniref:Uncharacterized protein n=1 Tax=Methylomonas koyamae TaxID=702114 RepID=A0A177MWS2_9GAMM|nr:hypothetical protein [Methylomonas koyamae]OAI10177.1 hypothetical protein A1507_21800 [Methylomonas koyamae]
MAARQSKKPYIAQSVDMIRSAAYLDLSGNAVKLLILMQTHWRMYEPVAYSISEAQKRIGCSAARPTKRFENWKATVLSS